MVIWLAEHGHSSARCALCTYATALLEDGRADLPSSMRAYLVRLINGLVPPHPQDRSDTLNNMLRDVGLNTMVEVASIRWTLPRYNSSNRHRSAAWYVAETMTRRGTKLHEQQVARICRGRPKMAQRLREFLLGANAEEHAF